jgi:hypothetical protein
MGRQPSTCHPEKVNHSKGLCRTCYGKIYDKEHYQAHKQAKLDYLLKRNYNLTREEYEKKCKEQGYLCLICKRKSKLCVDHDHRTGKVRGLLCSSCNAQLGYFEFYTERVERMIKYLEVYK